MRKSHLTTLLTVCLAAAVCLALTACSVSKTEGKKIRDVEFTVLDKEDVPEEFMVRIQEAKEKDMKLSYADKGYLYAARGYGVHDTSGYSVNVTRCYETEEGIHIETSLSGPGKEEKILKKKTYPYVVVKMEYADKPVEYD